MGRHKDPGALTILYQDDVRRRSDGEWARVKFVPGSFVINVGDTMQVLLVITGWLFVNCD